MSALRKKHLLTSLAITDSVKAFRIIEEFAADKTLEPDIAHWAVMAMMESRMLLESGLLEERQIFISTGLGGKGNKLRFFVLIFSKGLQPFKDYEKRVMEREFNYILPQYDCEIERMTILDNHVKLMILIPMKSDVKDVLIHTLGECNQYGDFISDGVTITNVKELSDEEIQKIAKSYHGKLDNDKAGN
jgi:hypothetical protein